MKATASTDNDGLDDRPAASFGSNGLHSEFEESKDRYGKGKDEDDSRQSLLLRDEEADESKYTVDGLRTPFYTSPFESIPLYSFGLDLNDTNRNLAEGFGSPFHRYYDE